MSRSTVFGFALSLAMLFLTIALCTAQPYSLNPFPGPDSQSYSLPQGVQYSDSAPTSSRPGGGAPPEAIPSVSTGQVASGLGQGEQVSEQVVRSYGQMESYPSTSIMATGTGPMPPTAVNFGLQYRILYNGYWSFGPAAISYGQSTNMLAYNTQPQRVWSYELYPRGREVWKYWGYWSPGYYNTWFYGDEAGWHQVAIYGDRSGWSNAIWVYVSRGYYPNPGPTWPPTRPGNPPAYPYDDGYPWYPMSIGIGSTMSNY